MKRVLCQKLPRPGETVELPSDEAKHAIQVFRLRDGDRVEAMDGKGHSVIALLRVRGKQNVLLELAPDQADPILRKVANTPAPRKQVVPIVLELAVLKGNAMEWAIEKAVELGIRTLIPLITERTIVQVDRKGPEAFQERWQKIADQALKQCGRLEKMDIALPEPFQDYISRSQLKASGETARIWCDEEGRETLLPLQEFLETLPAPRELRILIGPEGGWTPRERSLLEASAKAVSLGPLVLRAETAALFASSIASAHLRKAQS